MLPRCFRRSFASRTGWVPPSKQAQAQSNIPKPRASLDEPDIPAPRAFPGYEQQRHKQGGGTSAFYQLAPYAIAIIVGIYVASHLDERGRPWRPTFQPYTLIRKEHVSSTMSIFHLRPSPGSQASGAFSKAWRRGVWNVLFKQPQIQVVRAYTPLPPVDPSRETEDQQDLRFLIRHDQRGEVSSWLHRLPSESTIEIKGPNFESDLLPDASRITFLAGGTGIATALQVANVLLNYHVTNYSPAKLLVPKPSIHILWATRQREDCQGGVSDHAASTATRDSSSWHKKPPQTSGQAAPAEVAEKSLIVQELDALKLRFPGQVFVDYFVDEENTWITSEVVNKSISRDISQDPYASDPDGIRDVIISGPEGFINRFGGPKVWNGGRQEQGPLGGVVAQAIVESGHHARAWKV